MFDHSIVLFLSFGGRDIADRFEQPPMVEPVDPFKRGVFDSLEAAPGSTPVYDFGFVKAVDGLGQGVVIAVADASTDGSIPASASRSVYLIETYWLPRSL